MAVLEARNLSFSYSTGGQEAPVLRGLDFSLESGELVAIQGPSGSGKSTLLHILGGFLAPTAGSVTIGGRELSALRGGELAAFRGRMLGFVFQQFHLLPRADVLANILLAGEYPSEFRLERESARERARALAAELGLGKLLHQRPNQLSGGEQQRVAICRALLKNPRIILADEPTGNLDSATAGRIIDLFRSIQQKGKTVVIITHDPEIAARCDRVLEVRDGRLVGTRGRPAPAKQEAETEDTGIPTLPPRPVAVRNVLRNVTPLAFRSMLRNKGRSLLTMLGVAFGVASVLAMVTFGDFTQKQVLASYQELGVNKVVIRARENWNLKATDEVPAHFRELGWEKDVEPLLRIFPEIRLASPYFVNWSEQNVHHSGKTFHAGVRAVGAAPEYFTITGLELARGQNFSDYHVEQQSTACIIGSEIAGELFTGMNPIGRVLTVTGGERPFICRVLGVLRPHETSSNWVKPDRQIYLPWTYFRTVSAKWYSEFHRLAVQVRPGTDVEGFTHAVKRYFENRYGKSGRFHTDSNAMMVERMKQLTFLFKLLLGVIAGISLLVGGMGITNMMLASLSEQVKEVGIRRAHGATDLSVRAQYLMESVGLCGMAGVAGLAGGFSAYQLIIYGASKMTSSLEFEWIVDPAAWAIALFAILAVGVLSGLFPALKAERIPVTDALRGE